jgi:hypothetical protein
MAVASQRAARGKSRVRVNGVPFVIRLYATTDGKDAVCEIVPN